MEVPATIVEGIQLVHIARHPLYQSEKPYAADFQPLSERSNHVFNTAIVSIEDARLDKERFTLEKNGFCLLDCPTEATFSSLSSDHSAILSYYNEMEDFVQREFPQYSRVIVIEHQLRERDPGYPEASPKGKEGSQPARLVHRDFTTEGLFQRMEMSFPKQEEEYKAKEIDFLNVWRVLVGPNNDWPLAVCDYASIDPEHDTIPNDMLSRSTVGENELLIANPRHKWFFLSNQEIEETIIFRNASTDSKKSYAFHSAFDSKVPSDVLRQSIELRMVAFY